MNKRGRKASGVKTKVLYRRLPEEVVARMDDLITEQLKRHFKGEGVGALGVGERMEIPEPSAGFAGQVGVLVSKEDWKAGKVPFHAYDGPPVFRSDGKILDGSIAENEAKGQIKALLDDVERLTEQVSYLEGKVQEALGMDLDEKGRLGWKLYYQLKDEKEVNEHDQER